jgi:hypothetical protein
VTALAVCGCKSHAEADAAVAVICKARHIEFERWLVAHDARVFAPLPSDHETQLLAQPLNMPVLPVVTRYGPCRLSGCAGTIAHAAGHR